MLRFVLFLGCTFFLQIEKCVFAQDGPIKVKVFDGSPQKAEPPTTNKYNNKNYISINPYLLGRGAFAVGYERVLHFKHAVFVDLGLTYRDFVYEIFHDDANWSDRTITAKVGSYLSAGYKFYPKGYDDFDGGFYISPSFILRSYNLTEDIQYDNGSSTEVPAKVDASYNMQQYALKFGYCTESWWFDDLIADVYFGVGLGETTTHGYQVVNNALKLTTQTEQKPAIYLGVKIGFVF